MESADLNTIILGLLAVGLISLCLFIFFQNKIKSLKYKLEASTKEHFQLQIKLQQSQSESQQQQSKISQLTQQYNLIEQEKKYVQEQFISYKNDKQVLEERFENLANRILEEKGHQIQNKQLRNLSFILEPLQEKIKNFEEKVEKTHTANIQRHESLKEQIRQLSTQSEKVSQDANNLAKALKGDFKKQGNWGEMILENILDKSGLEKGREYHTQATMRNDEGQIQKPDIIIDLPDSKKIIIDSKVSLRAYEAMISAEEKEHMLICQKAHATAIRNHIDGLAQKNYHQLYKINSPDFVLMFIPIDSAFSSALQYDEQLYQYAFDKNIVIVSSSTLLATLKTVETMWRNEKHNKNALEIAVEAGKMYDKFSNFLHDMNKLGIQLNTVQRSYNDSMKKLHTGTGNLIARAEKIKALGAKTNKRIEGVS